MNNNDFEKLLSEELEYFTAGKYFTNSFVLKINEKYDFLKMTENNEAYSTFLHEYVHFLQNTLTPVGVYNNIKIVLRDLFLLNYKYNFSNENYDEKYVQLRTNFSFPTGTTKNDLLDESYYFANINGSTLSFSNGKETIDFEFGVSHIKECMAKICEKIVFNTNIKNSPINPYQIPYKMIEKLNKNILSNDFLILAILELSLHTKNPIITFYKLINLDYNNSTDLNEIKNNLIQNTKNDILSIPYSDFEKYVKELYKGSNFDGIRNWILLTIQKSKQLTQDNQFAISDLINKIKKNGTRELLIFASQKYRCPLISCNSGLNHFDEIAANSKLYYYKLIPATISLFYGKPITQCPNIEFCDVKKDYCLEATKSINAQLKLHGGLCPLGCVLKNYGYYEDK